MSKPNAPKREPWRIVVCVLGIAFIAYMWVKKDVAGIYATMPPEQVLPMVITSVAVSLVKTLALAGGILLVKWLFGKVAARFSK